MPDLTDGVVLITGANGGIGRELVAQALDRGTRKVYATARTPHTWDDPRVEALRLDVTNPDSIADVARAAPDVTVLINNAGANPPTGSIIDIDDADITSNLAINFLGPLHVTRAFIPTLKGHPRSAIVNVHSIASWYAYGGIYSAAKAALWSATNSLRLELAPHGVHVLGVHMSYVDTPMAAHASGAKLTPANLARQVFDALERDQHELIADEQTARVRSRLSGSLTDLYPELRAGQF